MIDAISASAIIRRAMKSPACLLLSILSAATIRAAVVDIPALKDTTLYESQAGALANGGGSYFFAGRTGQFSDSLRRGLIEFDIASVIPAGSIINSAQLVLNADKGGAGSTVVSVHRVTREWTEGTTIAPSGEGQGGAPVLGNDATWLHATSTSVFWNGPGAAGDFNAAASSIQTITDINAFYTWTGLNGDVQTWVNDSNQNHGWLLMGDEATASSSVRFASRNNASLGLRPVLHVDFTPVPEPSASVLAGIFVFTSLRRRTRTR